MKKQVRGRIDNSNTSSSKCSAHKKEVMGGSKVQESHSNCDKGAGKEEALSSPKVSIGGEHGRNKGTHTHKDVEEAHCNEKNAVLCRQLSIYTFKSQVKNR